MYRTRALQPWTIAGACRPAFSKHLPMLYAHVLTHKSILTHAHIYNASRCLPIRLSQPQAPAHPVQTPRQVGPKRHPLQGGVGRHDAVRGQCGERRIALVHVPHVGRGRWSHGQRGIGAVGSSCGWYHRVLGSLPNNSTCSRFTTACWPEHFQSYNILGMRVSVCTLCQPAEHPRPRA